MNKTKSCTRFSPLLSNYKFMAMKNLNVIFFTLLLLILALSSYAQVRRRAIREQEMHQPAYTAGQQRFKTLEPKVYDNFIEPDATVKVLDESGQIAVVPITGIKVKDKRQTIGYGSIIKSIDNETELKLKNKLSGTSVNVAEMKVLPELHLKTVTSDGQSYTYRVMFNSELPLRYDYKKLTFGSTISFILAEEPINPGSTALGEPMLLEVTSNSVRTITPKNINLSHLYTPSSNVELMDDQVQDSALIKIVTRLNPSGYETYIKVKPALQVTCARTSVQGLGIQEVPITVNYLGSNSDRSTKVSFQPERGTVTPGTIDLKYNETKTVMLRSEGIGETSVRAFSNGQECKTIVSFIFPWIFLLASLGGGLLGTLIKVMSTKARVTFKVKPFIYGMLIGLLGACTYYVLGLNLLHLEVSKLFNETAVFAFAVLCSLFGIRPEKER